MEQGCDAPDVGAHVQTLMEEYLRLKEAASGMLPVVSDEDSSLTTDDRRLITHDCDAVRQRVVDGMAPLVESIARRYAGTREMGGESLEDLISEGYVGLLTAIDQYRLDRGARFSTYATHRVHGQIRHYLRDRGNRRLIRAPSWLQELVGRLQKEEARLQTDLGREPTITELAARLNLKEEAVEELQTRGLGPSVLSLTERSGDDEEGAGGVDLGKFRHHHYVSWQLPIEDRIFLDGLMVRLKELERNVITLFFYQDLSQSEIARSMNISCNYVGYLLKNGLRKLRSHIEADELRDAQLRVTYSPRRISSDSCIIDSATGLYNGGYFRDRLAEEIARACRYRRHLALVVFRVEGGALWASGGDDGRQQTGECRPVRRRGRPRKVALPAVSEGVAGPAHDQRALTGDSPSDDLWRELGTVLRECLRKADIPARVDDRLLAVALPHTSSAAPAAAQRISQLLERVSRCKVSTGLALYPEDGREPAALLEQATDRLTAAPALTCDVEGAGSLDVSDPAPEPGIERPATSCV